VRGVEVIEPRAESRHALTTIELGSDGTLSER
jgi:hypothetical protein